MTGQPTDHPEASSPDEPSPADDIDRTKYTDQRPDPDATNYKDFAGSTDPQATNYSPQGSAPDGAAPEGRGATAGQGRTTRRLPCRFGGYDLLEMIGRGGMGIVYRARQVAANRMVAVKTILAGQLTSPDALERFRREATATAGMDHPGIVPVFEVGEVGGEHFYSMALIHGGSLQDRVKDSPLPPREGAEIVLRVAEAVQHVHDRGIIHRDLKPANILLASEERRAATGDGAPRECAAGTTPKLTDFGLARTTESAMSVSGEVMGTPSYMPPEQARGQRERVGPRSDVYSLGAVLYCALTGRPPFQASSLMETLRQVLDEDPVSPRLLNPGVPRNLETICLKCLAKESEKRYSSWTEVAEELDSYLRGESIKARPLGPLALAVKWSRQHFGAVGWTVVIGFVFGLVCGLLLWVSLVGRQLYPENLSPRNSTWLPSSSHWFEMRWPGLTAPLWEIFVLMGLALSTTGLVTALLVRPKNRGADVAAGAITGFISAVTMFSVSLGWLSVIVSTVFPVDRDLRSLAGAAFAEAEPGGHPLDALLRKYPFLERVPANLRGAVFAEKLRHDLIIRIPIGIWMGMFIALIFAEFGCVCSTMWAAALLRRYRDPRAVILPYAEVAVAMTACVTGLFFLWAEGYYRHGWRPDFLLVVLTWLTVASILCGWKGLVRLRRWGWLEGLVLTAAALALIFLVLTSLFEKSIAAWSLGNVSIRPDLFVVLLGLAMAAILRGWAWSVRLLLHLGWIAFLVLWRYC
jgi:hypothetical protein